MNFNPSDQWILKLNPSDMAIQASQTVTNGAGQFSVAADMAVSTSHIWIAPTGTGIIRE
jgi:hypothetical protein